VKLTVTVRRTDGYADLSADTVRIDHEAGEVQVIDSESRTTIPIETVSSVIAGEPAGDQCEVVPV